MPRVDALTGLRWWAAFLVFGYHMQVFAPVPGVTSAILGQGYMGVTFFFVLSGFVLTWSASKRVSQSTFYWRRFARIYPSHFVALLLAIPVFYSFTPDAAPDWVKPVSVPILALSFVLLQGWSLTPNILFSGNPAAWTLTCEAFFYAIHPYVSKVLMPRGKRGALWFAAGIIGLAFAYRGIALFVPESHFGVLPPPLVHVSEFILGMCVAWGFRRGWHPRIPVLLGLVCMVATLLGIVGLPAVFPGSVVAHIFTGFGTEIFTVACALAIVAIAQRAIDGRRSAFAWRVQVRLGEWSYAFYLVHATVMYSALAIFGTQPRSWTNLWWYVLLLGVAIAVAAALHHWVEKPLETRMRAWKDNHSGVRIWRSRKRKDVGKLTGSGSPTHLPDQETL